jgi:hypothetical protein
MSASGSGRWSLVGMIGPAAGGADLDLVEPVEFGSGLRSHIAREPESQLAATPLGPVGKPEPPPPAASTEWVRDLLRTRAGEHAERIWAVFDEALRATDGDGRPDHQLRLQAARTLLAEIYGPASPAQAEHPADELSRYRRAKETGSG